MKEGNREASRASFERRELVRLGIEEVVVRSSVVVLLRRWKKRGNRHERVEREERVRSLRRV